MLDVPEIMLCSAFAKHRSSLQDIGNRQGTLWLDVRPVPPTAAQGLEQRNRISVASGPGLGEAKHGLLIGLLRIKEAVR